MRHLSQFTENTSSDLNRGDKVLIFSPNCTLYPMATMATLAAGVVLACSGTAQTPKELAYQIKLTQPRHFIVHPSLLEVFLRTMELMGISLEESKRRTILLASPADMPPEILRQGWIAFSSLLAHESPWIPEDFSGSKSNEVSTV